MPSLKTVFLCSECGAESRKWVGRCPACGAWNTMMEEAVEKAPSQAKPAPVGANAMALPDVPMEDFGRRTTGIAELDRVLGGGVVQGSLVLIGGDPGIGKSTLLLQAAENLARDDTVLYVSGEESLRQIALRARRLGASSPNLKLLAETSVERILYQADRVNPGYIVIDSIQTMYRAGMTSSAGSVTQVRESAASFMSLAKDRGIPVLLVGDSAAMVVFGYDSTIPVTLDDMIPLTAAVSRATKRALVSLSDSLGMMTCGRPAARQMLVSCGPP